jgi:two-component system sensor histidine kinase BaeS
LRPARWRGRRPPWWPEGQAYPPARRWGRRGPPPFVWRFGCLFVAAIAAAAIAASATVGWLAGRYGVLPVVTFLVVFILLLGLAAGRTLRRLTRPMDDLIEAASRIEQGDYSAKVPESGPRELRSVARAFNSMSARLKTSDEQRRSFLAEVVHELRTPLAVIRGQAEGISDGVYAADEEHLSSIVDATRSLEVLVEDLRALALSETGSLVLNREPVEAAALAQESISTFESQAKAASVTLSAHVDDGLPMLDVDPVRMASAIGNVLANAIRHTPAGGLVRLSVSSRGDRIEISVVDNGEGISPEMLPHVFDRFVKGPGSRGSGLGLAIAHDIVVAHGGSIDIDSAPENGTTVRMTLPSAPA